MCFKGLNTSGCNTLADSHAVSHVSKSSSMKVTLNVLTDNPQIAVCRKMCRRLLEPLFPGETLFATTELYTSLLTWLKGN